MRMDSVILEDSRQKISHHELKHRYFDSNGIKYVRQALYVGDYSIANNMSISIDTKEGIQELVMDICGPQHERFRNECIRAQEAGIRLIILVENKGGEISHSGVYNKTITELSELHSWKNPRLFIWKNKKQAFPHATKGITLQKACYSMQQKYGVEFQFCRPEDAGKRIVEILTGEVAETATK